MSAPRVVIISFLVRRYRRVYLLLLLYYPSGPRLRSTVLEKRDLQIAARCRTINFFMYMLSLSYPIAMITSETNSGTVTNIFNTYFGNVS